VRQRSQTIGSLGRVPARQQRAPAEPTPRGPDEPPEEHGGAVRRWLHGALFVNTGLKFLSLVLAVTVFLLVNTDKDREITVRVGVKYEYPADKVLVSEPLDEVKVTIKGPLRRLRQFDERELGRIELDLRDAPTGEIAITNGMISNLPRDLTVLSINPKSVRVAFDRRIEKVVEVTPVLGGRAQHGYVAGETKVTPATIKVRGAERLLAAMTSVRTTEVSIEGRTDSFDQLAEVAVPDGVSVDPTLRIQVQVRIVEQLVTTTLPSLKVSVRGEGVDPARWQVVPAQIVVTLTGAVLAIEKAKESMVPVVKLFAAESKAREAEIVLDGLPPGVGVRISPERVRVTPVAPVKPPPPP
jgi:YbbR domain-containing protein